MRKLSPTFIENLKSNYGLIELMYFIKHDGTLDLEIRENKINIYYRGGNTLGITETSKGELKFHFDNNYFLSFVALMQNSLPTLNLETNWKKYFPIIKQGMDFYFSEHPKEEREFQQLVVRENNYSSIANSTDYFIIDIEYDNHNSARFDMVALEWESNKIGRAHV